jgi:bloom syndrome protein
MANRPAVFYVCSFNGEALSDRHLISSTDYTFRDQKAILDLLSNNLDSRPDTSKERTSRMVEYCEDKSQCRRVHLLRYFGENFDKQNCRNACDNCANSGLFVSRDLSTEAKLAVALVQATEDVRDNITVRQCIEVFRGLKTEDTRKNARASNPQYGAGTELFHDLVNLLFDRLLYLGMLVEHRVYKNRVNYHYYVKVCFPCAATNFCIHKISRSGRWGKNPSRSVKELT